jgi:hypothetical protein
MKFTLAILCVSIVTAASAQNGISNARDGNGNLVRSSGLNPNRTVDQMSGNNLNNPRLPPAINSAQKPKANGTR